MKHYYIKFYRNPTNEYDLFSVEAKSEAEEMLVSKCFKRITRKEAFAIRARENLPPNSIEPFENSIDFSIDWLLSLDW